MTDQTIPSPHLLDIDSAVLAGHRLAEQLCCAMTRNGWSVSDFPDHPQGQEASRVLCEEFVGWLLKSDAEAAALPLEYRIQSLDVVVNRLQADLDRLSNIDGVSSVQMEPDRRLKAEQIFFEMNADFIVARAEEELSYLMALQTRAPALSIHADHLSTNKPVSTQRFKRG